MQVAIVNGICLRDDAISNSVRGMQRAIQLAYGREPTIYCYACDFPSIAHRIVERPADLLFDPNFMGADLVVYHFGVHYGLFDAIFLGTRAKQAVYYHNVTPAELLPASQHAVITRSARQKANLAVADAIWAASPFNRADLIDHGLEPDRITVEPLFLKFDPDRSKGDEPRPPGPVELLFVGRFVESKGLVDLIEAVAKARDRVAPPFRLRLAGNQRFSDQGFLATLRGRVGELGLDRITSFEGQVSDARLAELYARADLFVLPSYHEGFCVPLIEALNARCVPLTYDAGNLPDLVGPWGVTIRTGDRSAYAAALGDLIGQFANGRPGRLDLAGASLSWTQFDRGVGDYLQRFSFTAFRQRIVAAIERLAPATAGAERGSQSVDA